MSTDEFFGKFTDRYERQARLYPSILATMPLLAIAVGIYGIPLEPKSSLTALLASCGVIYLLTTISRELGKRRESNLFAAWGGKPTTQILRHRNQILDPVTKARYHAFLSGRILVPFPTAEAENADPVAADAAYASGARWLLDQTRDVKKFPLLFKELIAYGFRRNCLGLKPIAVIVAFLALTWLLSTSNVLDKAGFNFQALIETPMSTRVVLTIDLVMAAVWTLFISKRTVRTAAFMYADLLVRACDELESDRPKTR
jgi:hypothetical protein